MDDAQAERTDDQDEFLVYHGKELSDNVKIEDDRDQRLLFKAADHPPIYLTLFCGFQVVCISDL